MPDATGDIRFNRCGIGTALKQNRLAVPPNQREYAWQDEHIKALFQDFSRCIQNKQTSYFLGTIVLTKGKGDTLEVADGQQRLATSTILLAAIRDYFHLKGDKLLCQGRNTGAGTQGSGVFDSPSLLSFRCSNPKNVSTGPFPAIYPSPSPQTTKIPPHYLRSIMR